MEPSPKFASAEEQEISRGGKATAGWIVGLAVVVIAGGAALGILLQHRAGPPNRPGTTSATTPAGETKPPSP
jgi:hypothetical protein